MNFGNFTRLTPFHVSILRAARRWKSKRGTGGCRNGS